MTSEAKKIKKIAVFTATRAEYGLLYWLMKAIEEHDDFQLQLLVSGTHLSKLHGHTIDKVIEDGFQIDVEINLDLSVQDSRLDVTHAMSKATKGVADALQELKPDMLVLLGDRYELLGAASAALIMAVPIFHLHGGEITEGAYDDSIRHAVTKMATWHGVANDEYKNRVIQMGESENKVFTVGAMGLDNIKKLSLLSKVELEQDLNFKFREKTVLVTFHPVTNAENPIEGFLEMMEVLQQQRDLHVIFTYPNADHGRNEIVSGINEFVKQYPNRSLCVKSLGQLKFLSALQYVDVIIGNSSSGIFEASSFNIPTVNIGVRQYGRIRASSVIDCDNQVESIQAAVDKALTNNRLQNVVNPFGDGEASEKIMDIFSSLEFR